ncbi:unnamed protein product [Polarella glacialis]|uniref:Uncharacterized protein n=1 Tax=Polarella glacialis TaxID=89957 RepID=A0A813L4F4_POLGL|nr:unnamed protein product [Polarella glacialis]
MEDGARDVLPGLEDDRPSSGGSGDEDSGPPTTGGAGCEPQEPKVSGPVTTSPFSFTTEGVPPEPLEEPDSAAGASALHCAVAPEEPEPPEEPDPTAEESSCAEAQAAAAAAASAAAEVVEWQQKVQEQRALLAQSDRCRGELRASVEGLQQQVASLTGERERLLKGGASEDAEELEAQMAAAQKETSDAESSLAKSSSALDEARAAAAAAASAADVQASELLEEETDVAQLRSSADSSEASAAAARERVRGMVAVSEVQRHEAESKELRESLAIVGIESRQLRLALAEALSSGADLPTAMKELEVLRESAEAASQRVKALETSNAQLEGRLAQIDKDIARLRKGTVDLRSEEDLMREVIFERNEELLRKVEDLTEEEHVAAEDRRQLLCAAVSRVTMVDSAEARIAKRSDLEAKINSLEAAHKTSSAEVERLRRTNGAMFQQVLGSDGEGPFAGALEQGSMLDSEEDIAFRDEIGRLVRGQLLLTTQAGSVKADAGALALAVQQLLAEREEAFWVERQRLSDHVISLERAKGGRTSALLREYDATARGGGSSSSSASSQGLAAAPAAAASAVRGGLQRLQKSFLSA